MKRKILSGSRNSVCCHFGERFAFLIYCIGEKRKMLRAAKMGEKANVPHGGRGDRYLNPLNTESSGDFTHILMA